MLRYKYTSRPVVRKTIRLCILNINPMHIIKDFEVSTTRREQSLFETLPPPQDGTAHAVAGGILLGAMMFGLAPSKIITRQAMCIFGHYSIDITKKISESPTSVVTIRVLDEKISYTSMCNGDTLEYDATAGTLVVTGTTKCQLPKNLKIVGNPEHVEPLSLVPVHLEVVSMEHLVQALEESQIKSYSLEAQVSTLEQRLASIERKLSGNPFI